MARKGEVVCGNQPKSNSPGFRSGITYCNSSVSVRTLTEPFQQVEPIANTTCA